MLTRVGWSLLALFAALLAAFAAVVQVRIVPPAVAPTVEPAPRGFMSRIPTGAIPQMVVPVAGVGLAAIHDSWGDARAAGQRAHHGTDIMAPAGTPVLAAGPGVIEKLHLSEAGGVTLYIRSPDRHWTYYYAHLAGYAPGVGEGRVVRAGELVGYVGDTGNAGAGNTHLHFGLTRTTPADRWYGGEPVNPYPLLASGRAGG